MMNLHNVVVADIKPKTESAPLRDRLLATRALSTELAAPLSDEDQVVQANDDASPTKWHLAHTTWFFEAFLLKRFLAGYRVFDERFEYCFNSYYESVGARQPRGKRGLLTRPSADEVRDYRAFVDQALARLLDTALAPEAAELIELGINHEQQHQELLLTDILSLFAAEPLKPAYREAAPGIGAGHATPLDWIDFEGGIFEVGHDGDGFAYDNEGPRHEALIHPFKLASRPVTNAEWIAFIEDGGYATPTLWLADGWNTVKSQAWEGPLYFEQAEGGYGQMSLMGFRPVDPARAGHPCQLLRGRRLRPLGRLPAAHGIRVGGGVGERAGRWPRRSAPAICDRCRRGSARGCSRCSAMCGNGRRAPISPIPASRPQPERSANITASSCAISSC